MTKLYAYLLSNLFDCAINCTCVLCFVQLTYYRTKQLNGHVVQGGTKDRVAISNLTINALRLRA